MVKLLLGLDAAPSPHDAADALAVAICHIHTSHGAVASADPGATSLVATGARGSRRRHSSWRHYRPLIARLTARWSKSPEPPDRRRRRRRLRRAGAAVHVLRPRRCRRRR